MARSYIAGPGELSIRRKTLCCTGRLGPERVGRGAKGSFGRRSGELRASGAVGLRWQPVFGCQIVWNRSTRRAGERGGARVGRPRWLRILSITGGSSRAAVQNAVDRYSRVEKERVLVLALVAGYQHGSRKGSSPPLAFLVLGVCAAERFFHEATLKSGMNEPFHFNFPGEKVCLRMFPTV